MPTDTTPWSTMMRSLDPGVRDVSVLTPPHEYGRFIADGIESVVQQQRLRVQHIIQDAGSGDETLEDLRSFGDRVVEWASETDLGQSDGLNRALAKATGVWISWLDLRWFKERNGVDTFRLLLDRCYSIRTDAESSMPRGEMNAVKTPRWHGGHPA